MRRAISVVLVLAFMLGVVPTFSTPAHAWGGFNFASIRQSASNFLIGGCFLNLFCGVSQSNNQTAVIVQ